jgi:hypothetical protein
MLQIHFEKKKKNHSKFIYYTANLKISNSVCIHRSQKHWIRATTTPRSLEEIQSALSVPMDLTYHRLFRKQKQERKSIHIQYKHNFFWKCSFVLKYFWAIVGWIHSRTHRYRGPTVQYSNYLHTICIVLGIASSLKMI